MIRVRDVVAAGLLGVAAMTLATSRPALAQQSDDSLNLPADVTILSKPDPSIRKATAIVNGSIITDTDIDQRLQLVVTANGGKVPEDERDRLRLQVLRNLIDETLEIQEAKVDDIKISQDDIDATYARVANQFKKTPQQFADYLHSQGSSASSMKRQIEGELAWQRVLNRKVQPFVNVGDDEVKAVINRLKASKGAKEYHVAEIFLSSTPATQAQVTTNLNQIVEQLRKGASFPAYARQYSEASTAAVGGDLGWVRAEQLPDALAQAVQQMQPGQLSTPIAVGGGYSLIALIDSRQVLMADPRDAVLSLKQISVAFPKGAGKEQMSARVQQLTEKAKTISGCGGVEKTAAEVGGESVANDSVRVRDLPPQLQDIMLKLSVGQATPVFGSAEDGVRVLVLCGRDDPEVAAAGPSFDQVYAQMQEERVNKRAQRYLRDLRRDAVVDYR
ncbi:MAG: peptidylprolyl isomerase [Sphingomonadaceae bacterium]|nr:peptidylprolyl isomerase [Sphingomonadaceae bacterium]